MEHKLLYPVLLIKNSFKKTFSGMGRILKKSRDKVAEFLLSYEENALQMLLNARISFKKSTFLYLVFDDTLIQKIHAKSMTGSWFYYDTKSGRCVNSFKLLVAMISDGTMHLPIACSFLLPKELIDQENQTKDWLVKSIILDVIKKFPDKKICVTFDGAFASKSIIGWACENNIAVECRFHSNRIIYYDGQRSAVSKIKKLIPKGRQKSRTIKATWHSFNVFITAHRRIDKHEEETIVYQLATYKARPNQHVQTYKKRWCIEKAFRTTKQKLGLCDCQSKNGITQLNHMSAVFLAYSMIQIEMKKLKIKTPEETIRRLQTHKITNLKHRFLSADQIFGVHHA